MSIKDEIRACTKCPLFANMQVSPIPPEWCGHPDIMIITSTLLNEENDLMQENVTNINRDRLLNLLNDVGIHNYYITNLIKCIPKNKKYSLKYIEICLDWLTEEYNRLKPKAVIFCINNQYLNKLNKKNNFKNIYIANTVTNIVLSKKNENKFKKLLLKVQSDINGY